MADKLQLLLEAERRGILPPDKAAMLSEARKRGLVGESKKQPPTPAPSIGGMGGYNPFAGRLMGAQRAVLEQAGVTPEMAEKQFNPAGIGEVLPTAATSIVASPVAGLAGLGQGVANLFGGQTNPGDRVRQVQEALTYRPRTAEGTLMTRAIGAPFEALSAITNKAGEAVSDATGSPALGAGIKTLGDVAPGVIAARGIPRQAPQPKGKYTPAQPAAVPTTAELTAAAKQAYKTGKESGVVVSADSYGKALGRVQSAIKDVGINNTLHPKTAALLKQLDEAKGKDLSITEAENLRGVIQEVAGDLDPVTRKPTGDAFRANKILDEFDDALDALSVNSDARALWSRSRRSQMIDDMIHRAEIRAGAHYTQAGMEHALRQEFKQLALNPRRMRGLTREQRAAIERVAKGGPLENTLRALGKFDPTTGGMGTLVSLGSAGLAGAATGGAGFALPAVGFVARRAATRATGRNVDAAREALVGRDPAIASPRATAPATKQGAAGTAPPASSSGAAKSRPIEKIQADMQKLVQDIEALGPDVEANSPRVLLMRMRWELLQRELAKAEGGATASQGK